MDLRFNTKYQMRVLSEDPRGSIDERTSRGERLGYPDYCAFAGTRYRIEYSRKLGYPEKSASDGIQYQIEYSKEDSLRRRFDEASKYKRRKNCGAHFFQQFYKTIQSLNQQVLIKDSMIVYLSMQ